MNCWIGIYHHHQAHVSCKVSFPKVSHSSFLHILGIQLPFLYFFSNPTLMLVFFPDKTPPVLLSVLNSVLQFACASNSMHLRYRDATHQVCSQSPFYLSFFFFGILMIARYDRPDCIFWSHSNTLTLNRNGLNWYIYWIVIKRWCVFFLVF